MSTISDIVAREILDSRGNPTVEVDVVLSDGSRGRASVASGTSTGANEALELRDGEDARFGGKGVLRAGENVNRKIGPELFGRPVFDQESIDQLMIDMDGTDNKSSLGANAILGVSMAVAHAAALSKGVELYEYLANGGEFSLPIPMFNILNGGKHAHDSTDFQEFMVVPAGFETFREATRAGAEVYQTLHKILRDRGYGTTVGDEGGPAPSGVTNIGALSLVTEAIETAGYRPGEQCFIAIDVAATELRFEGSYFLAKQRRLLSSDELISLYVDSVNDFPIISIEDGMAEDDWVGWVAQMARLGDKIQLVGDDIYVTNPVLIEKGFQMRASNSVLIKLNQIGTVTETLEAIRLTKQIGWGTVISHRSGETEDTTIADLVVGTAAGQFKAGAPARGERTAKYNRLLRIEEQLAGKADFIGPSIYDRFTHT